MSLQRFVDAQNPVYDRVRDELKNGQKRSHWMWFVFPQIAGLGSSDMARRFAIASLEEARAYLEHAILGPRLRECVALINAVEGRGITQILGNPDDIKLRSSLTLFAHATADNQLFLDSLAKFYAGAMDDATLNQIVTRPRNLGSA